MAFWDRFRTKRVEKKSVTLGLSESLGDFLKFGQIGATASGALSLYEKSTAVSIPINMVVDSFAQFEPVLLIDDKRIPSHPVIDLLKKPSPYYTTELFFDKIGRDYLITGECFFVMLGMVDKPPIEIQPITPNNITVPPIGDQGVPSHYAVSGRTLNGEYTPERITGNEVRYYDSRRLREMKQIRNYSTRDNSLLRGQSLLISASRDARQHILGMEHNISILEKGGRVSLVFNFAEGMDDEDFEIARDRVNAQFGGSENAGKIGVSAGGELEIVELGKTNKDMDFVNLQKSAQKSVALQFRVPLPLVSDERMTMGNYEGAKLALYDDAAIPLSNKILGGLSDVLLPRYGLDPMRARITYDPDKVTALVMRRNTELVKRRQIDCETDNEIRALLGREPYEGGDQVLKPANMIAAGTDVFTADNDLDVIETTDD